MEQKEYPWVEQICNFKWAAHGDGWAVHGATKEEAIENYQKAEQRRRELLEMWPRGAKPSEAKEK